jgi:hypothetical protein
MQVDVIYCISMSYEILTKILTDNLTVCTLQFSQSFFCYRFRNDIFQTFATGWVRACSSKGLCDKKDPVSFVRKYNRFVLLRLELLLC